MKLHYLYLSDWIQRLLEWTWWFWIFNIPILFFFVERRILFWIGPFFRFCLFTLFLFPFIFFFSLNSHDLINFLNLFLFWRFSFALIKNVSKKHLISWKRILFLVMGYNLMYKRFKKLFIFLNLFFLFIFIFFSIWFEI